MRFKFVTCVYCGFETPVSELFSFCSVCHRRIYGF